LEGSIRKTGRRVQRGRAKSDVNQPLLPPVRVRKPAGDLYLSGLTSLSDAAAESLSGHEGSLSFDLDALPESSAEILRQHPSFQDG